MNTQFSFKTKVRLRNNGEAPASWHFVTLPKKLAKEIKLYTASQPRKGWGSVKVEAQVGFCKRKTSIFPSKPHDSFLLPVKADVRKQLQIKDGDSILVYLHCL